MTNSNIPHWDLSNVFPGLESDAFKASVTALKADLTGMEGYLNDHYIGESGALPVEPAALAQVTAGYLQRMNALIRSMRTLFAYVQSFIATDSYNTTAKRVMSELGMLRPRLDQIDVRFSAWIGRIDAQNPDALRAAAALNPEVALHAFVLQKTAEQSRYQMSEAEENLASELNLSGAVAWGQLRGVVTSQLKVPVELDGETQHLSLAAAQNVRRYNPDEAIRHKVFDAEIAALASIREPVAACMNGVKGTVLTLNKHRGRTGSSARTAGPVAHRPRDAGCNDGRDDGVLSSLPHLLS